MPVVLIANPKGGVGKTTVASNLAGWFANQGHRTMLGDLDRQQSAAGWLKLRPAGVARIETWTFDRDHIARPPAAVTHVVLDSPAGLHGHTLKDALRVADRVVVPLQASMFDILATHAFLERLGERGEIKPGGRVAIVGMRVDARTRAADQLARFVGGLGIPVLGFLRDTQNYVQLAARGLTLWDVAPSRVPKDVEQWQPLLDWVRK